MEATMGGRTRRRGVVGLLLPVLLAACGGGPTESGGVDVAALRAAVTPELAATIRADGTIPLGELPGPLSLPVIPEAQARELAIAVMRQEFWIAGSLAEDRGGKPVDFATARPCGPALLARSPVVDLTPDLPQEVINFLGARWLILFCDQAGPAAHIAVAAHFPELRVGEDGRLLFPQGRGGSWFEWTGVTWDRRVPAMSTPEAAVLGTHAATGGRVARAPVLMRVPGWGGIHSVWWTPLEQPVRVRPGRDEPRDERDLFWGNMGRYGDAARLLVGREGGRSVELEYEGRPIVLRLVDGMPRELAAGSLGGGQ
ncbi:MAG: hypothetical protein NW201_05390 [Gemmatimonadales bacterium]|nr:hypothetical protein [Gemmatimonadales bacterium]